MASYRLKEISFSGRRVKILCQNENGPCPLLSICNVLLLNGSIAIHPDYGEISLENVIQIVANRIIESSQSVNASEEVKLMQQERAGEVISILPKLQFGLDVNVKFDGVGNFEYTRELDCFDAAGVPIYHGWILDPQDRVTAEVIDKMSYNHCIYKLVEYRTLCDEIKTKEGSSESKDGNSTSSIALSAAQEKLMHDGRVIEAFLNDTASQLTYMGLLALHDTVREGVLCTFFRNNHFNTMLKRDGKLYLLVTDLGYIHEPSVVWELLDEIDGNTELMDSSFLPSGSASALDTSNQPAAASSSPIIGNNIIDPDVLLAMQLSQDEKSSEPPTQNAANYITGVCAPASRVPTSPASTNLVPSQPEMPNANPDVADSSGEIVDQENEDRRHAESLQDEWRAQEAQYEADRQEAMRLQQEIQREALPQDDNAGFNMTKQEVEAYKKAEMEYFRQKNSQQCDVRLSSNNLQQGSESASPGQRGRMYRENPEAKSSSSCVVS